jgi:diadenosine tetraphosphate (Ap4A) HIT family hydrolase
MFHTPGTDAGMRYYGVYHFRKDHKQYNSFPKPKDCSFCEDDFTARTVEETKHAVVVTNRVAYNLWELRTVIDHYMIVPKKHVHELQELSDEALADIVRLIAKYEAAGYNIYARAANNNQRSVHHQHTHLIKTANGRIRGSLFIKKPYFLFKF